MDEIHIERSLINSIFSQALRLKNPRVWFRARARVTTDIED
jgi:hypothetical protein